MNTSGIPVSRWIDGVLEDKTLMAQNDNIRAMVFWGHAPNSQTRSPEMKAAMEKPVTLEGATVTVGGCSTMGTASRPNTEGSCSCVTHMDAV